MNKFGVLLFILFTTSLFAQNVNLNDSKMNYGNPYLFHNARALGMGGSGIADGNNGSDFLLNPALGILNPSDLSISAKGHLNKYQEDRSFPYYDSFGGFVDYGSYVFNENWYNDYSGTVNYLPPFEIGGESNRIAIALSISPILDFDYYYAEEVRTTNFGDAILAYNKLQSDGMLQEISFSVAVKVLNILSAGLHVGTVLGDIDQSQSINPVSDDQNIEINRFKEIQRNTITSTPTMKFGFFYQTTEFLSFGSTISLPYTLKVDVNRNSEVYDSTNTFALTKQTYNREIEYPLTLGFGLNYKFTNLLLARLNFDFEYTFWSDINDDINPDLRFDDSYRIMVGVEHMFMDNVPFRLGFNYSPLRENKNITQTILTAGTGMTVDNFSIELSAGISSLTYNQLDMYDNALYGETSRGEEALDRVETDSFYGMIEINYFLDL